MFAAACISCTYAGKGRLAAFPSPHMRLPSGLTGSTINWSNNAHRQRAFQQNECGCRDQCSGFLHISGKATAAVSDDYRPFPTSVWDYRVLSVSDGVLTITGNCVSYDEGRMCTIQVSRIWKLTMRCRPCCLVISAHCSCSVGNLTEALTTCCHLYPTMAHAAPHYLAVTAMSNHSEFDYQFLTGSKNPVISYGKIWLRSTRSCKGQ